MIDLPLIEGQSDELVRCSVHRSAIPELSPDCPRELKVIAQTMRADAEQLPNYRTYEAAGEEGYVGIACSR